MARLGRVIVDAHLDIAYNSVMLGRDFLLSAYTKRARESPSLSEQEGVATVGFPEMEAVNLRVVFASIWAAACDNFMGVTFDPCYRTAEEASEQGLRQLAYYEDLTKDSRLTIIRGRSGLEEVTGSDRHRLGIVLAMEGADPIISPKHLHSWVERGLRVVGLSHGRTGYAGGTRQPGPLTQLGRELLAEMEHEPTILDTSHMAEESFFDAIELFNGPIIATHSNCRTIVPTDRHLSDEMIRAIVKRDGVIGTVLYNKFLTPDWKKGLGAKEQVTLSHLVQHVRHVCDVAGDSNHVGIGSDLDGGFGSESIPAELDTIADAPKIAKALTEGGFSERQVDNIMGQNWLRFLSRTLPS